LQNNPNKEMGEAMNGFCPNCEKESPLLIVRKAEDFNVRGEVISVEVEFYRCQECGEEFENSKTAIDPYEIAYREYRTRKGLLQPEDIREFRIKRSFTQKEFSDLLGIGIATLNRYENGALQSEAHDRVIKLVMEPRNFSSLISNSQGILSDSKKQKIISQLAEETEVSWLENTKEVFGNYNADLYSGYKKFDLSKFFEAIKFFCYQERIYKTKLMKLLFYADFGHFKKYSVSITGARYARLPYGPVPDQFEKWLAALIFDDDGVRKEEEWNQDYPGEVYVGNTAPDLSIFSPSELRILASVKEVFQNFSAKKISDFSHNEKGYQETESTRLISYSYASELSLEF
jgi:putative zinc finger/helix-turn-helix YgiT family protein